MTALRPGWAEAGGRALAQASKNGADVSLLRGAQKPQAFTQLTSLTPERERILRSHRAGKRGRQQKAIERALEAALGKVEE